MGPGGMRTIRGCGWLLLLIACCSAAGEQRPSLLFLLSDDHRNDFLGCAGHPVLRTPHLDRLSRQGVRFSQAFVTTSICAASRASLFTGLTERTHGYTFGTPPLAPSLAQASYPRLLRQAGYQTGFVGKFGIRAAREDIDAMFDSFVPLGRSPYFKMQEDGSLRHLTEITGDRAIEFLERRDPGRPFCLSVSFNAAHAEDGDKEDHYPWPRAVDGLYEDLEIPPPRLSRPEDFESQPAFLKESLNRDRYFWRWDTPEKYQRNVKAYYRMISGLDHAAGRILAALERLGLREETIVIFTGDNGYYKGSRGFAGKWSHYEESLRVPLILHDPRLPGELSSRVIERMALNIDIPSTLLDYAGVEIPEEWQGRSLRPLAEARPVEDWRSDFFCEHLFDHPRIPKWEGVRAGRFVYARYFEQDPPFEFLHDLHEDPLQRRNLAEHEDLAGVLMSLRLRCGHYKALYER